MGHVRVRVGKGSIRRSMRIYDQIMRVAFINFASYLYLGLPYLQRA